MKIDVLTLFPEMVDGFLRTSILGKALEREIIRLRVVNFREFSGNKHGTVDDYPYGGGGGMILKPEPIFAAVEHLIATCGSPVEGPAAAAEADRQASFSADDDAWASSSPSGARRRVILMCPQGETYSQRKAEELSEEEHLIFICGHYEGYDERIREHLVTDEMSIGDFVLTGGEIAACAVIDSVVRLLPGVLGNERSAVTDSFSTGLLEYPQYTRPAEFRGWSVPDVLLSGHHENVAKWRHEQSLYRTWRRRPDLLRSADLSARDWEMIRSWEAETETEKRRREDSRTEPHPYE